MFVVAALSFISQQAFGSNDTRTIPDLRLVRSSPLKSTPFGIIWSKDSKKLAACSSSCNFITIWNEQGDIIGEVNRPGGFFLRRGLGFLNNGRRIAAPPKSINDTETLFSVFDIGSDIVVQQIPGPKPGAKFGNRAYIVAVSPDQSIVAAVAGTDIGTTIEPVRLYDADNLTHVTVITESAQAPWVGIRCLSFSEDSRVLVIGRTDGSVLVYDLVARRIVRAIDAFTKSRIPLMSIALSPDGQFVAVGGVKEGAKWRHPDESPAPPNEGAIVAPDPVRVYRISDGALMASETVSFGLVFSMTWRAQGGLLAFVSSGNSLHLWDPWHPGVPEKVLQLGYDATSVAISPDGSLLATGGGGRLLLYQFDESNDRVGK